MSNNKFMSKQSVKEIIEEYGAAAYSPDFGAWAELEYEENGQTYKRQTMIIGNPQWSGALDVAQGEYLWKWAYDTESNLYFLLLTWHSGLRLPVAFDQEGAGKMLFDKQVKEKFDVMLVDQPVMPRNWDDGKLKFNIIWDVSFDKAKEMSWPK